MLSTFKASLKVSLISLILIFSLTEVSQAHRHRSYSHDDRDPRADNPNWMSALPDTVRLSQLSIPGTHESMSHFAGFGVPLNFVKCQTMRLGTQLHSGIRALDIRCAVVNHGSGPGGFFNIYHGNQFQRATFNDVLNTVVDFLKKHPSETVLMRVKEEYTDRRERFEAIFRDYYWNNDDYKPYWWNPPTMSQNPTLGEMRGKIVILQDFARKDCCGGDYRCLAGCTTPDKAKYGICYCSFDTQDTFRLNHIRELYHKWERVQNHLVKANTGFDTDLNGDTKFMNYLSGGGPLPWTVDPYFVVSGHRNPATGAARLLTGHRERGNETLFRDFPRIGGAIYYEGTNTLVYDYIRCRPNIKRVGIIMTDFPGKGLIERIICINYEATDALCRRQPNDEPCPPRQLQ
jgi:1-phosphatidylinositol phosphodiesterase